MTGLSEPGLPLIQRLALAAGVERASANGYKTRTSALREVYGAALSPDAQTAERAADSSESSIPVFRAHTWLVLAGLLRRIPDDALLRQLADGGGGEGEFGTARVALAEAAGDVLARSRQADLDDEFHDLFIGIGRGELVPYASWYRTGFLMDRPLVALRRDLALLGLERDASVREPEDHAAALAEVMALLADAAAGQDASTQRLFFCEHIDPWMPSFFADLQTAANADFYRPVGRLGAAFIDLERDWLAAGEQPAHVEEMKS